LTGFPPQVRKKISLLQELLDLYQQPAQQQKVGISSPSIVDGVR